jgi:hypothetical protein
MYRGDEARRISSYRALAWFNRTPVLAFSYPPMMTFKPRFIFGEQRDALFGKTATVEQGRAE